MFNIDAFKLILLKSHVSYPIGVNYLNMEILQSLRKKVLNSVARVKEN